MPTIASFQWSKPGNYVFGFNAEGNDYRMDTWNFPVSFISQPFMINGLYIIPGFCNITINEVDASHVQFMNDLSESNFRINGWNSLSMFSIGY